jgi:hypothetical protein
LQNTAGVTVAGVDASGNGVGGLAHPPTFKNLITNGAMQVHQRGTSVTGITSGDTVKTADRWNISCDTIGTWTQSVENDAPTGSGFRKSLKMLCTTADASPSGSDNLIFSQKFEGQNLQQIAKGTSSAKELTVSFWVKSNVTGTYILDLFDLDNTRQVSKAYTVSASGTWEKKTITFPADTTGALDNDNALSFAVNWWLGAGSTFTSGTLNTSWASNTSANRAVGQTNLAASTNNYWQVTGVQLEVGSTATEFEFKPYAQELQECQRYFYMHIDRISDRPIANGTYYSTNDFRTVLQLPVFMRIEPTISASSGTDYFRFYRANAGDSFNSLSVVIASNSTVELTNTTEVSGTGGDAGFIRTNNASTYLGFSAEL